MELADVLDSKSSPGDRVRVRPPPPAPAFLICNPGSQLSGSLTGTLTQPPFQPNILGLVAQLGERRVRNAEVESSILFESTMKKDAARPIALS